MAKEFYFLYQHLALRELDLETVFLKNVEHYLDMSEVFLDRLREDEDVVHVDDNEFAKMLAENRGQETVEGRHRVGQAHRHDVELK